MKHHLLPLQVLFLFLACGRCVSGEALVVKTIIVDKSGKGDYISIQDAVNSVPDNNNDWIKIHVKGGVYDEKVQIGPSKTNIVLEGEGSQQTFIQHGDYSETQFDGLEQSSADGKLNTFNSSTFMALAPNFVAKNISFVNTYGSSSSDPHRPAVAALVGGDKMSFYGCSFVGFQDTLCDYLGRHYFKDCWIEGAIDFIFGYGQSIYENCHIEVKGGINEGYITAHAQNTPGDKSGFVFKDGSIGGPGKALLGRAWNPSSTVLFYRVNMNDVIVPRGWEAWKAIGKESQTTYAEKDCTGPSASTVNRVPWEKKLSDDIWDTFIDDKFIDAEGWRSQQP